jgi:hypothetical protein
MLTISKPFSGLEIPCHGINIAAFNIVSPTISVLSKAVTVECDIPQGAISLKDFADFNQCKCKCTKNETLTGVRIANHVL